MGVGHVHCGGASAAEGASILTIAVGFEDERVVLLLEDQAHWDSFCWAASDKLEGFAPPSLWQKALSEPGMLVLYGPANGVKAL